MGDEVCVVIGSQVPMVLRRISDAQERLDVRIGRHRDKHDERIYVGQAYIHELMVYHGDLGEDIQRGEIIVEKRWLV
ncbi:hypothetical protein F4778DRAFT_723345 [Xylariomycetidae sp. FL2044]|nr:hypothetical protein F4778DRAFT_723345 [Xylariomycetidae sp. FL2044]